VSTTLQTCQHTSAAVLRSAALRHAPCNSSTPLPTLLTALLPLLSCNASTQTRRQAKN